MTTFLKKNPKSIFPKRNNISKNTIFRIDNDVSEKAIYEKTRHFTKHDNISGKQSKSDNRTFKKHNISQKTTAFQMLCFLKSLCFGECRRVLSFRATVQKRPRELKIWFGNE